LLELFIAAGDYYFAGGEYFLVGQAHFNIPVGNGAPGGNPLDPKNNNQGRQI
jgi:hypothetical protein